MTLLFTLKIRTISDFLEKKTNNPEYIFINLCFQTGGYYKYVDGWRLEITNWDYGEPRSQPCVLVNKNGKWSTADCNQNATSICMKTTGRAYVQDIVICDSS